MTDLQKQIEELIEIAKVPPEKMDKVRHDLNRWILAARRVLSEPSERKKPQDYNHLFDDIENSAKSLVDAIKHVDTTNEYAICLNFWWGWHEHEREQVLGTLGRIVEAARDAKIEKKGRPPLQWKQAIVYQADVAFHSIKSPELQATEYEHGPFIHFVKKFCAAAKGEDVGPIIVQARKAIKWRNEMERRSQQKRRSPRK